MADRFLFSCLLNEAYREILYLTYNYQKDILSQNEISKLSQNDFKALSKSKLLRSFPLNLFSLKDDFSQFIDEKALEIMRIGLYDKESATYLINYMNGYIETYIESIEKMIDSISSVLDVKMNLKGSKGNYPLYIKIEENKLTLDRAILNTNASQYLDKKTIKFGFKITFISYRVALKDYSYNGKDLRKLSREEIVSTMDNSVSINLNDCTYQDTDLLSYRENLAYESGELSFFLDKTTPTYGGIKKAFKESFKRTGFTILIIIVITIVFVLFKYLKK